MRSIELATRLEKPMVSRLWLELPWRTCRSWRFEAKRGFVGVRRSFELMVEWSIGVPLRRMARG